MKSAVSLLLHLFSALKLCATSPVVSNELKSSGNFTPPDNICFLPSETGYSGLATLMEDCETLHHFDKEVPKHAYAITGSSIYVCCPSKVHKDAISFLAGQESTDEGEDYYFEYGTDEAGSGSSPEDRCNQDGLDCSDIELCSDEDFEGDEPPKTCGVADNGNDKVCCNPAEKRERETPQKKHGDYNCTDLNEACKGFAELDPESCHHPTHNFMKLGCMESCNRCGSKGCVDEFAKCEDWSRAGHCVRYPEFMFFNCRESCGSCGFKSPRNNDTQVVNGRAYSNITDGKLFCGEGKLKKEFAPKVKREAENEPETAAADGGDSDDFELFSYSTTDSNITCGSTIINDRFIVFAAHCQSQFQNADVRTVFRSIILRHETDFEENIEIRRIFVHPDFLFPSLYNDIAIGELGRRIIYDYDKYGDSPACLGKQGKDLDGQIAVSQGYGLTENDTYSTVLLEGNVTIISNEFCTDMLKRNVTGKRISLQKLNLQLNQLITPSLMCSIGFYNETRNAFSGPCKGDSGGPLYINYGTPPESRIQTLEGIVSGGLTCGKNIPAWYTRVSAFRPWMDCIVKLAGRGYPKEKVEGICKCVDRESKPTGNGGHLEKEKKDPAKIEEICLGEYLQEQV